MVSAQGPDLLPEFTAWSVAEPAIVAVVLFGSRARETMAPADGWSDLDVQVVTTRPDVFSSREWTAVFSGRTLWAYVVRPASGGVKKVTVMFSPGQELDVVVVPAAKLRMARVAVSLGLHRKVPAVARALDEMATVLRSGHRVLKGGRGWASFYAQVVGEVRGTRLDDEEVRALAEEFLCDWWWVKQKVARGELVAAQRVLHRSLVEINFRLLHERRLRAGDVSFREARRVERIVTPAQLSGISIESRLDAVSLEAAAEKCAATCRELVHGLIGDTWRWPIT